jgi:malate dehydrogenase
MGVLSDGSYGVAEDLVYSFPVKIVEGRVMIVKDLVMNEFSKQKLKLSEAELSEEKEAVKHLF